MVVLWVLEGNKFLIKNLTYTRRVSFSFYLRVKLRLVKTLHAKQEIEKTENKQR